MIQLEGVGRNYVPEKTYTLILSLDRPGVKRAGFQFAVSDRDGNPVGTPAVSTDSLEVIDGYLRTTDASSRQNAWRFLWTAPEAATGELFVNIAANAANDDDSPFGDTIYVREIVLKVDASERKK